MVRDAGFHFVDIKHCHGYLGHEFLSAFTRPGPYGGSFENRTRFLREIVAGIRTQAPGLDIHVMGGARMGRDPKTSVLNGWNQVHACPNVFVTDGACMTSTATQNPSLTYMAIAARAANYAADQMDKGLL